MIKNFLLIYIFNFFSACSNNNIVQNKNYKENQNLVCFLKMLEKGINIRFTWTKSDKSNINVNGYLWRASLNVLSIAPLISTDALGGTIITDWYTNKNIKDKRIKITAYIKTSELRSDGIKLKSMFKNS